MTGTPVEASLRDGLISELIDHNGVCIAATGKSSGSAKYKVFPKLNTYLLKFPLAELFRSSQLYNLTADRVVRCEQTLHVLTPSICNPSLYIAIIYKSIVQLKNPDKFRMY